MKLRRPLLWIVLLALVAWSGSLVRGGFAFDDREVLFGNPVVEGRVPWTRAFTQDYWAHLSPAGHYRPLAVLSLRADRALFGERPAGYHATNVLLHALVVLLAGLVLAAVCGGRAPPPWLGLAVFAAHPALADSVAWISGRTSMVSALGGLAAAAAISRRAVATRLPLVFAASAAGLLASLLGKEDGVVFAPLLVLVALTHTRRAAVASAAGCGAALIAYAWLRHVALGHWMPAAPHAPLAGAALLERAEVAGRALAEGLRVAAVPVGYPPRYGTAAFDAQDGMGGGASAVALLAWLWLVALAVLGAAVLVRGRGATRTAGASALLVAAAVLPHMQLVPSGVLFAPRYLYLPLLLGAPLVATLWGLTVSPRVARALAAVLLVAYVGLAWQRAAAYASRAAFWEAAIAERPADAPAWNALGNAYAELGEGERARDAWRRALALDPAYSRPAVNLGTAYLAAGELETAEIWLVRGAAAGPENPVAHANLANLYLRTDRVPEALAAYERAVELAPGRGALWRGLARARERSDDLAGAIEAARRALALDPGDDSARALLERLER